MTIARQNDPKLVHEFNINWDDYSLIEINNDSHIKYGPEFRKKNIEHLNRIRNEKLLCVYRKIISRFKSCKVEDYWFEIDLHFEPDLTEYKSGKNSSTFTNMVAEQFLTSMEYKFKIHIKVSHHGYKRIKILDEDFLHALEDYKDFGMLFMYNLIRK